MLIFLKTLLASLVSIFRIACCPRAREPGPTPSNRHAPQVCWKVPKIDLGRPPTVDLSVAPLARLALGVGHRQPETVVAWYRAALRLFWTWKVRCGKPGRPVISSEVRDLIRKMCRENPGWGAPVGVHRASTSGRAVSANIWCAAANRRLRHGAPSWRTMPSSWSRSTYSPCPPSVSRFFTYFW